MRLFASAVVASALLAPVVSAQNATPAFEVASVRRNTDAPFSFPGLMLQPGGRATSPGTSVRLMLKSLLAERFQLVAHLEKRELPALALVLAERNGKLGPRLQRSGPECAWLSGRRLTMAHLVAPLTQLTRRPVVDETG